MTKPELQKKLEPLIDKFIEGLLSIKANIESALTEAQNELLKAQDDRKAIREQEIANEALNKAKLEELKAEKERFEGLNRQLSDEISKNTQLNSSLADKIKKADDNLKETEELKRLASVELENRKKKSEDFSKKTFLLAEDFGKLAIKDKSLKDREEKLNLKEKSLLNQENALLNREQVCAETELDLAIKKKRIDFETKKLNLT